MNHEPQPATQSPPDQSPRTWRNFAVVAGLLLLAFGLPLYQLVRFAAESNLYSYILLIPFVSVYLVWVQWGKLPSPGDPAKLPAIMLALGGLAALASYALLFNTGAALTEDDYLALMVTALVMLMAAAGCWLLGKNLMWRLGFSFGFLIFLAPLPTIFLHGIETFLQHGSALTAEIFFQLSGMTFLRDGLLFQLPTITLQVAPECSGIRASLVLLITSTVASYLFLKSPWKRSILVLAVIPLALLRNGFRVFVIGELCVRVGPEMVHSPIHHQGGPIFFALSLIPFFFLLFLLKRSERPKKNLKH